MTERKNNGRGFGGKGYYIALILCAVAIGISGFLYYRNAKDGDASLQNPADQTQDVMGTEPEDNVAAVATQPSGTAQSGTAATDSSAAAPQKSLQTAYPVDGETVAVYAMDSLSYNATTRDWRVHNGIDIAAETGTEVRAAADGTVYTTYVDDTMGTTVVIRHADGYTTKYSSLAEELSVSAGDEVVLGQVIGCVGSTALLESAIGDHVHFSVTHNDEVMDPEEFFAMQ